LRSVKRLERFPLTFFLSPVAGERKKKRGSFNFSNDWNGWNHWNHVEELKTFKQFI
jgi:hypothetical protein